MKKDLDVEEGDGEIEPVERGLAGASRAPLGPSPPDDDAGDTAIGWPPPPAV